MFEEPRLVPGANLVQLPRLAAVDQVASHHDRLVVNREVKYKTIKCVGRLGSAVDLQLILSSFVSNDGSTFTFHTFSLE